MSIAASNTHPPAGEGARTEAPRLWERMRLSASKAKELLALSLLTTGLFLGLSLISYRPEDPSLFHHTAEPAAIRNWIGPLGAHLAGALLGLFGIASVPLPLILILTGFRRFRSAAVERVVGRGIGALVLMATLPGLLQLLLGTARVRGELLATGGGIGLVTQRLLEANVGFLGSLLLLAAAAVTGVMLIVQSTFGELLRALRGRVTTAWHDMSMARSRRRERREKVLRHLETTENLRKVMEKHQRRREEGEEDDHLELVPAPAARSSAPRVVHRRGEVARPLRRVAMDDLGFNPKAEVPEDEVQQKPSRAVAVYCKSPSAAEPQKAIDFPRQVGPNLPPLNLLHLSDENAKIDESELVKQGDAIRGRCAEFGVVGEVVSISPGPVITVYEFQPAPGVKVSQIVNLQDDLALALKADSVRVDRLPGRSTLGIEVPNRNRSMIRLGSLLASDTFRNAPSPLTLALGVTISGEPFYADLAAMPHLLVAGATGAGKSVGLQSMITSILYKASKDEVKFIFIDPKRVELGVYRDIPHLKAEVVVDPKQAANALRWVVSEMERRYRLLAEVHVRSIAYYNQAIRDPQVQERLSLGDEGDVRLEDLKPLPYYVVIIDELADLMMVASTEVETCIARLAQMARAVGIHMIMATQRPSVDVLTGTIKANFPCRISFATTTRHDSRTILDQVGSEQLLGKGDMLFMAPATSRLLRLHGAYLGEQETAGLIRWLRKQGPPELDPAVLEGGEGSGRGGGGSESDDGDELFNEAARLVVAEGQASASFLQRRMRIGFSRAARLIDMMERDGLLGPPQGSKPREVLVKPDFYEELDRGRVE